MDATALYGALVVFAVIGGLELVDRTSFSLMALAARQSPVRTWMGGALAFLGSTAVAVSIGAALVAAIGPSNLGWLRVGGGAFLIAYAVWLYVHVDEPDRPPAQGHSAMIAALSITFLLEMGDTTMIFETVFVATYGWLIVLVVGAAALISVAAFACTVGATLGARVEPARMKQIVVAVLVVVGVLTMLYGLYPTAFSWLG